jgi:integrase
MDAPDWVFASLGAILEERNLRTVFTRLLEKTGLRYICAYDLRHTFASLLLQHDDSIVYVKEQLGHASIQVADPFVIALARVHGLTVVTAERASGSPQKPRIRTSASALG